MPKDTTTEHPCFFCWLAGFIDGEGCFYIGHRQARGDYLTYHAGLMLQVRIDERAVLDEIVRRTGLGNVRPVRPSAAARAANPATREQVLWQVASKRDCASLIALLEQHPQHAKKRCDFEIWGKAVRCWQTKRYRNDQPNDWTDMARLKEQLGAVRTSGLGGSVPIPEASEAEHQLSFPGRVADPA